MKKYLPFLLLAFFIFIILNCQQAASQNLTRINPSKKTAQQKVWVLPQQKNIAAEVRWSGTISVVEKYSGLTGISERHIDVSFDNALPTLNRNIETTDFNFTDDKGTGTVTEHAEVIISRDEKTGRETREKCDCTGNGKSELHEIVINHTEKTYFIHAIPPECKGSPSPDGSCGGASWDILISEKPYGMDPYLLSGSETLVRDITVGTVTTTTKWNLQGCPPWSDPQTRLRAVDARVKAAALRFIKRAHDELCLKLKVASGFRTFKEQDSLHAIGRPPPPLETVTNAKGGESFHNYGFAVDIYIVKDNGLLDLKKRIPPEAIKIAIEEGFEWGGNWPKFKDYPHFEMRFGKKIKDL